jgi:hypothetical protein
MEKGIVLNKKCMNMNVKVACMKINRRAHKAVVIALGRYLDKVKNK